MKTIGTTILCHTAFLDFVRVDYVDHNGLQREWFGVRRVGQVAAVSIAAITDAGELILVRQDRPLVGGKTIELPAGLMDIAGESVCDTGKRELLEETGYTGLTFTQLVGGESGLTASAGITDERHYLVYASNVSQVAEPLTNEGTEPLLLPLANACEQLGTLVQGGFDVDYALFGTIRLIQSLEMNHG